MKSKHFAPFLSALLFLSWLSGAAAQSLRTTAETSDYKEVTRYAEIMAFCERLAKESPVVRLADMGKSNEGRKLPLIILADPPISSPEEAAKSGKPVIYAQGDIHAGEVDGKEALLMLARDLALAKDRPLLKGLIILFAPTFNPDGAEKIGKNRASQGGPELVGTRANAQGFDLNRDFVKLETPEVRALVRVLNRWDPAVVIDCHTTNGSHHRYKLTYEGPRCPAGDPALVQFTRDRMLPDVGRRLEKATGFKSFFYGNFSDDRSRWDTVSPMPRYSTHYVGLRNRIGILSESYSYASFKDRVLASKSFVQSILEYSAENRTQLNKLLSEARVTTVKLGQEPSDKNVVALRYRSVPQARPVNILGFVEEKKGERRVPTDKPRDYEAFYTGDSETTLSVTRPYAYLYPASQASVTENLQRHGIKVEELREDIDLDVEIYQVEKITRGKEFQKHQMTSVDAKMRKVTRRADAGSILVRTAQPLGSLAVHLLEPQSADGLVTWNFFDAALNEGKDFPVQRLPTHTPLLSGAVRALAENRKKDRPITFDTLYGGGPPPNFNGSPISGLAWLEDGQHFLQVKEGRLLKVHALSGRSKPFFDAKKLADSLAALPTVGRQTADSLAKSAFLQMNPQRIAALFEHQSDLYHAKLDGTGAVRLTRTPGREELSTFSPDGKFVAFVRDNNLYVVDVATRTERALTTDGSELIFNGKADWVYFEEIFHRGRHAFWWSPDSARIAFLRFDDTPVRKFTIVDPVAARQTPEITPYPKAGEPNPHVKLGILTVGGGPPRWADLAEYFDTSSLVIRAGWLPDSQKVYCYVQDRAQTWLDFCTVPADGGTPTRLFRETTKAWVDDPGPPSFLKDGSFLLPSERTGWKHIYHFAADGKLKGPVTSGEWEARALHRVDEENGWVYLSGTRDSHLGTNLYRAKLQGGSLQRLTNATGDHRALVSPRGDLFIDVWSDRQTPTKARLARADQSQARMLDTNPVYILEEYLRGQHEMVQIPTPDGFVLEGSILKPPNFDPQKRYPVWFMTYAGPHAPTIHDNWAFGRVKDEMLAQMGFIVFRADPRSASGKGACSTWTAYRQLGIPELKDIETAIAWLTKRPYIDAKRIGMSGASYGGFMTAFAMTHSKIFAAGISSAPVTDWRYYDSIYTERYMNTPQENPDGYNATSVVKAASKLHGKLLIVHGLMDDNVHAQNSLHFIDALQRADKSFEVMVYPKNRHGFGGKHYERMSIEFMRSALGQTP